MEVMDTKQTQEVIQQKINVKILHLYKESIPYIVAIIMIYLVIGFYFKVPTYYTFYALWHLVGFLIVIRFYSENSTGRVRITLIRFFISGVTMFYVENYSLFAYIDAFFFIIAASFDVKGLKSYILGLLMYAALALKPFLVYYGYISGSEIVVKDCLFTYVIILGLFILIYIINISSREFLIENLTKLEKNLYELHKLAYFDKLTGIHNEDYFAKNLDKVMKGKPEGSTVIIFNIKNMRTINLTYGEQVGDNIIKEIANILEDIKNENEFVARVNGNEFSMLFFENETKDRAREILKMLKDKFFIEHVGVKIDYLVGCAEYDESCLSGKDWLHKASVTISYLKRNKISGIGYYNLELEKSIIREERISEEIKKELENDGFELHYQCRVDAMTGKTVGVEALARWHSEVFGSLSPYHFIPVIERLELSNEFGELIIKKAMSDYSRIVKKYGRGVALSINISPAHIMSKGFKETILSLLKEYMISPHNIILEITEDVLIDGLDKVNLVFEELRQLGVKISLDDFGTGYSSLNYLLGLSIDELKIDKTFIDNLTVSHRTEEMLNFLIDLGNLYNLEIVCEGVETSEQCEKLLEMGCPIIQGYYFSKPSPL